MKYIAPFLFILVLAGGAFGQDTLIHVSGEEVEMEIEAQAQSDALTDVGYKCLFLGFGYTSAGFLFGVFIPPLIGVEVDPKDVWIGPILGAGIGSGLGLSEVMTSIEVPNDYIAELRGKGMSDENVALYRSVYRKETRKNALIQYCVGVAGSAVLFFALTRIIENTYESSPFGRDWDFYDGPL